MKIYNYNMVADNSNEKNFKVYKNEVIDLINKIKMYINNSNNIYFDNSEDYQNFSKWKNTILSNIDTILEYKLYEVAKKLGISENYIINKNKINEQYEIDRNKKEIYNKQQIKVRKFDYYSPKEIEEKNKYITINFQSFSSKFIKDDDITENKTLGEYLFDIAKLSRISLRDSNEFLELLYRKYIEPNNKNEITIFNIDQFRMDFSSWVKKDNNGIVSNLFINFYKNKLTQISVINGQIDENKRKYFVKLYIDLLDLYYQSKLSFPSIEINFDQEDSNYNSQKMMDPFGNKATATTTVNFVYFPSLYSNGLFLENGKQWVFTKYINRKKEETFFVKKKDLESLLYLEKSIKKFHIPKLSDKLELNIREEKLLIPNINFKISENLKKEYIFHLKNKNSNEIEEVKNNSMIKIDENKELVKCDILLNNQIITSFPK